MPGAPNFVSNKNTNAMHKSIKIFAILLFAAINVNLFAAETTLLKTEVFGKGQPIVMIPGLTCSGDVWDETVEKLKSNYECHVITLPGFAGQAAIKDHEGQYLEKMKQLVIAYIEDNKLEKPVIMGHSLGGFLALKIAIAKPDLPAKLVIVDSLPFLTAIQMPNATEESAKPIAQNMKAQIVAGANATREQRAAYQKMMLKSLIIDEKQIDLATEWSLESDPETVGQAMYELYTTDIRDELANIKTPTLVLGAWIAYQNYGITRESTLANFKAQYAKLNNVTIDLTDKGNHFIMWDDPEFFQSWITKFM